MLLGSSPGSAPTPRSLSTCILTGSKPWLYGVYIVSAGEVWCAFPVPGLWKMNQISLSIFLYVSLSFSLFTIFKEIVIVLCKEHNAEEQREKQK